jgi:general secretion pathway protein B
MSLILEALKKSEQQRRLGEAPTLASPVVATRRRRSLLPVLAILVIAAVATAWWLMRPHAPTPPAPAAPVAAPSANPVAATPKSVARTPAPTVPDTHAQDRAKLAAADAARRNAQRPDQGKRVAGTESTARATPPAPASAIAKGAAPAVPTTPLPPVKKPGDAGDMVPQPAATPEHTVATAAPATGKTDAPPASSKSDASAPKADKPADAGAELPSIWDLPFATRKDIPAINLSMHVYSTDPKQRFVVIKGDRHVEGDEVASDLILREIRQDGLVLEYKGQRFFFPRSGR